MIARGGALEDPRGLRDFYAEQAWRCAEAQDGAGAAYCALHLRDLEAALAHAAAWARAA